MSTFRPSSHSYGQTTLLTSAIAASAGVAAGASAGAAAGGAAASSSASGHLDPKGFLGLNWRAIGASILIGSLVAVGTDITLTLIKPRLFGQKPEGEKKQA
jgi:hypothetical protein